MNKNELVSAVADKANLSKGDAQSAVDAVFSVITEELKQGGDVRLVGFGNFRVSRREASTGRNPQTGAAGKIPARNVPKSSAGEALQDAVNGRAKPSLYEEKSRASLGFSVFGVPAIHHHPGRGAAVFRNQSRQCLLGSGSRSAGGDDVRRPPAPSRFNHRQ